MLELLFIVILLNFIYAARNYYMFINPASSFTFGLLCAVLVSIIYKQDWYLNNFLPSTFVIVSLGVTTFNIVSSLVWRNKFCCQNNLKNVAANFRANHFSINNHVTFSILVFLIVVCYWEYKYKLQAVGTSSIFTAMSEFDQEYKYGDKIEVPILLRNLILLRTCICYYFFYMLSKIIAMKDSCGNRLNIILICVVGLIGGFLSGSRGNVINYFLFSLYVWSIFKTLSNPKFRFFSLKKTLTVTAGIFISVALFLKSTEWVGRDLEGWKLSDYFAIYCGGEIKNLDTFVKEENKRNSKVELFTLHNILGGVSENQTSDARERVQFREVKGHNLGNVYTAFQNYYSDIGYLGVVFYVGLMAFIVLLLYIRSLDKRVIKKRFDFILFLYAYFSTTVAYSFFHERFYAAMSWYTVKLIIELYLFNLLMNRFEKNKSRQLCLKQKNLQ